MSLALRHASVPLFGVQERTPRHGFHKRGVFPQHAGVLQGWRDVLICNLSVCGARSVDLMSLSGVFLMATNEHFASLGVIPSLPGVSCTLESAK
jgi:hypothetical protein